MDDSSRAEDSSRARANPFRIPSNEGMAVLREKARLEKAAAREVAASKPVWERDIFGSVMARTRRLVEDIAPAVHKGDAARVKAARASLGAVAATVPRDRRSARESVIDLVARNRASLLTNLGLEVKRKEIEKLDGELVARERALRTAEGVLEEDAVVFGTFLHNNDAVAAAAVAKAEDASKLKAAKAHELKKIKHAIATVTVDKARIGENLNEKRRYKAFLDKLTPKEHFAVVEARQAARQVELREILLAERVRAWETEREACEAALLTRLVDERKASLRLGRAFPMPDVPALVLAQMPPKPVLADVPVPELSEADLEVPMFFTSTTQLSELFVSLEESNLFLIQLCQDTEQALEELSAAANDTSTEAAATEKARAAVVATLTHQISVEESKVSALVRAAAADGASKEEAGGGTVLDAIQPIARSRVIEIFSRAGFQPSASSDIISMLTAMEGRIEALVLQLATLDPSYVASAFKDGERRRRTDVRAARQKAAQELHDERMVKMINNALAPPPQRAGKPIMYRSLLPSQRDRGESDEGGGDDVDTDEARFFTQD